jgi:phenylalanine-4-hydroxylase
VNRALHAGGEAELVALDHDHPGFRDPVYRRRRNEIARLALEYREGDPVPTIDYTEVEHQVWGTIWQSLDPLHARYACREYRECSSVVRLDRGRIPQLGELNEALARTTGFRLLPVAGLVSARMFLAYLGRGVFLATQYMRHHSRPFYTPEPDVVHELVGHAVTFVHPEFGRLNRAFGDAVARVPDGERFERIARLYWYTLEFGVVREADGLKVYGAGLLSSFGELGRFEKESTLRALDVEEIAATPYDPSRYQDTLWVAPSFGEMTDRVLEFLGKA